MAINKIKDKLVGFSVTSEPLSFKCAIPLEELPDSASAYNLTAEGYRNDNVSDNIYDLNDIIVFSVDEESDLKELAEFIKSNKNKGGEVSGQVALYPSACYEFEGYPLSLGVYYIDLRVDAELFVQPNFPVGKEVW